MQGILKDVDSLDPEFIEAADGRKLTEEEISRVFDKDKSFKVWGRVLTAPEIGCVASHRKCYEQLLNSYSEYALILEDDIAPIPKEFEKILPSIIDQINLSKPQIILLSDNFWYKKAKPFYRKYCISDVYTAIFAHSYIINRKAAEIILSQRGFYVADNWMQIRRLGIVIKAVKPHLIEQKWDENFTTSIQNEKIKRPRKPIPVLFKLLRDKACKKFLKITGRYYPSHANKKDWEMAQNRFS